MIHFGNGVVEFVPKTRLPRFTPLPLFYPFQLAETKVIVFWIISILYTLSNNEVII
jgi:hypothetical protein